MNRLNPAREKLESKITSLKENLELIKAANLDWPERNEIIRICQDFLNKATEYLESRARHPHLIWELLHRVDEYFILLIKDEELYNRSHQVKTSFDLNIKELKVREEYLGKEGILLKAMEEIAQKKDLNKNRYLIKDALNIVNENMDYTFWQLSQNLLTKVCSGALLGLLILLSWLSWKIFKTPELHTLIDGGLGLNYLMLIGLGLMGYYLSNLMAKEDFLYVQGAPYWRYFIHNVLTKPVMSAFAAIFIYMLEKSKLIFSINVIPDGANKAYPLINLNVGMESVGYVYAMLAIVSGFAADKLLGDMIDGVLKKLHQDAEKTMNAEKK
jgi:hypothetical protein